MAVVTFDAHHPFTSLLACGKGLLARFAEYQARRRDYWLVKEQLRGMSDRELNDLAIGRSDFHAIAQGTFRR